MFSHLKNHKMALMIFTILWCLQAIKASLFLNLIVRSKVASQEKEWASIESMNIKLKDIQKSI